MHGPRGIKPWANDRLEKGKRSRTSVICIITALGQKYILMYEAVFYCIQPLVCLGQDWLVKWAAILQVTNFLNFFHLRTFNWCCWACQPGTLPLRYSPFPNQLDQMCMVKQVKHKVWQPRLTKHGCTRRKEYFAVGMQKTLGGSSFTLCPCLAQVIFCKAKKTIQAPSDGYK